MKQQRYRFKIAGLVLISMFVVLMLYGGYTMLTNGNRWFSSAHNTRLHTQKENVTPGDILDRNGVILATTVNGERQYQSDVKARSAIAHLIGDNLGMVANGVETFESTYLLGFDASLGELAGELLGGGARKGNTVILTVDSALCTAIPSFFEAHETTAGKNGAAVVMNWKTGEVLALVSLPVFDPAHITEQTLADPGHPFWNRATQAIYPPGSTFKTVTTVTALNSIDGVLQKSYLCADGLPDSNPYADVVNRISEFNGVRSHQASFLLNEAFYRSCNKVFAHLALECGHKALKKTAEAFGFNDNFLFRDLVVYDSVFPAESSDPIENAACGYGQSGVAATPMHMCLIAAALANDGTMMEPRLLKEVQNAGGRTRLDFSSAVYRNVCSVDNAKTLQDLMLQVTERGSGTAARVRGMDIRGKTGTSEAVLVAEKTAARSAETAGEETETGLDASGKQDGAEDALTDPDDAPSGMKHMNYGWMIAFCQDDETPYAVSVLVEDIDNGEGGGTSAAYIVRDIFSYLKNEREKLK